MRPDKNITDAISNSDPNVLEQLSTTSDIPEATNNRVFDIKSMIDETFTAIEFLSKQDSVSVTSIAPVDESILSNDAVVNVAPNKCDDILPLSEVKTDANVSNSQTITANSSAAGEPVIYEKVTFTSVKQSPSTPSPKGSLKKSAKKIVTETITKAIMKEEESALASIDLATNIVATSDVTTVATLSLPLLPQITDSTKDSSQYEFERHARMLLAEGKVSTYEAAEIAVKLLELNFEEKDSLTAAEECSDLYSAVSFLQQECELCANRYPMGKMVPMLFCVHRCCSDCAVKYFSLLIRDRNIMELICPFCNEPDLTDDDIAQEYFNNLDIVLKSLLAPEIHELFQRKIRDRALMKDPNFHWCSQCTFGFIAPPLTKRLVCPDCKVITCAQCRKPWEKQHEGISCEKFAEWQTHNDPEFQAKGLEKHLEENGIDCPNCRFRYALAKGGCMHFRCLQCQFDFCSGCGRPFKMGQKCNFSNHCSRLGLHAHHPRNCLFYLRDKEPAELQKLLTENGIDFDTEPPGKPVSDVIVKCPVMEQKDIPGEGLKDDICGNIVQTGFAGLCRLHYIEYLGNFIRKYNIDPIMIFTEDDLEACLRRCNIKIPPRNNLSLPEYHLNLKKMIQEEIPLDETSR